jgi:hypothetical protein
MLTFLQLSDIHFRDSGSLVEGDARPVDYDFRERLVADARTAVREIGGVSGILICGDIANRGAGSEFGQAIEWLQNLCAAIDIDPWLVWVVPGNHDLDQRRIGDEQCQLRTDLRACTPADVDALFEQILADADKHSALLEPLENYLEFASTYSCAFGPEPFWTERLELTSHELELRGVNSALVCGPGDNPEDKPMVIGDRQATVENSPGVVHYTLCHHPSSWLVDRPGVDLLFEERVHVRVTGHLHLRDLRNTPCGVYLSAGAVSPDRDPMGGFTAPCVPRYELVSLRVVEIDSAPNLEIFVRGRVWSDLDGWQADSEPRGTVGRRYRLGDPNSGEDIPVESAEQAADISRPRHELRYLLARLQAYDRDRCAEEINAPLDTILQAPSHRQVGELFDWAESNGRLAALWSAVFAAAQINDPPENPFT